MLEDTAGLPAGFLDLDPALRPASWPLRLHAAEAWLSAQAQRDPVIWLNAIALVADRVERKRATMIANGTWQADRGGGRRVG